MIKAQGIHYKHKNFRILNGVDVSLDYGELLSIVGPNGAGKSSLLSILANEIKSNQQSYIFFKNKALSDWHIQDLSKHKAKFSQHNNHDIPLQVKDIVMMGRYPYFTGHPEKQDWDAMNKILLETDLFYLKDRDYYTLSGGEKQRVHFARLMVQLENNLSHKIAFLDEPLNHMDIKYQHLLMGVIKDFTRKSNGAIVVLHDLNLAAQFSDKILLMKNGEVLAYGKPQEVYTQQNISKAYNFSCSICENPIHPSPMIIFGESTCAREGAVNLKI
ncbi:ATP-binding cassette domain-containing protein [Elizabethkingia argentiflava]|uniref:ATP-binding cassette domain-containing protein n=1 Tax=Elizabethkingia argenteiflava TaxID=2681556 RepID=A0A845Q047_9FLAO|nr:ATP-binding cassette domain-containing protein [Elizabethkingia argenteiflava]NAW51700.1 ATP-binding cassette domain-containing protein [Elizabethkingia argenteiflava]